MERNFAKFKANAFAIRKLKGKEKCEKECSEKATFVYNSVQKANATERFILTLQLNFYTWFSHVDPFEIKTLRRGQSDFHQKFSF